MDLITLQKIVNNKFVNQDLVDGINQTFEKYQINTKLRQCHFLAQILHESGLFKYTLELASGQAYEGRVSLGNLQKGDGVKFKGRGYIQITGRFNYDKLSKEFNIDFISDPKLLENNPYAMLSAGWYWNLHNLNEFADKDDIITITRKINGGLNGFDDRKKWLEKCKGVII